MNSPKTHVEKVNDEDEWGWIYNPHTQMHETFTV